MSAKSTAKSAQSGSSSRGFDMELAELEALSERMKSGESPDAETVAHLRKALGHRSNFIVSKAAKLVGEVELAVLLPDVLTAYDRFFVDAVKSDPQCWAKNALSKTLVKLEHRSKDAYLRGMRHHQLEPVWGGSSDTAGALRGTCTHALVDCPGISDADLLTALLEPLTDTDKTVRAEAARAVGQVGGVSAALLLRLSALKAAAEPEAEVMGAVYSSLLSLEPVGAIALVAKAMEAGDDLAAEAAFALAEVRSAEALAALLARWKAGADAWFGSVLLSAIALTRQPAAVDLLLAMIARDAREAPAALEAMGRIAPNAETVARIAEAVDQADSDRLRQAMRQYLPAAPQVT